jgi:DNA-directed RNA polymerase specialized sigma24 family protein
MKNWELTEESLNLFLSWLSKDRDAAGKKYEDIRHRLIFILECRHCMCADEVADEAINRFIGRLPELIETFKGDPFNYILVTARHIQQEKDRKQNLSLSDDLNDVPSETVEDDELDELIHNCLDRCLSDLEPKNRDLLLNYYQTDYQNQIDFRKRLANQLGIAANALRIRVHRLRATVHSCLNKCLGANLPS